MYFTSFSSQFQILVPEFFWSWCSRSRSWWWRRWWIRWMSSSCWPRRRRIHIWRSIVKMASRFTTAYVFCSIRLLPQVIWSLYWILFFSHHFLVAHASTWKMYQHFEAFLQVVALMIKKVLMLSPLIRVQMVLFPKRYKISCKKSHRYHLRIWRNKHARHFYAVDSSKHLF